MDRLAEICERVAATNSRLRKTALLSAYFRDLDDKDLERAVSFLCGRPILREHTAKLSVGHAALREAALAAMPWDLETLRICLREAGDGGEGIGLLLRNHPGVEALPLERAEELYVRLLLARDTSQKVALLSEAFRRYRPLAVAYLIKMASGNPRIGLMEKMVEEAVAAAHALPAATIREANSKLGNLAQVAVAARRGELEKIEAELFRPLDFMLAKPIEAIANVAAPEEWIVEDKYDGIRAQIHRSETRTRIFTRGKEDASAAFPELTDAISRLQSPAIFDGEILAWREGRALPFGVLQQRIARKRVSAALRDEVPVVFIAYDLLYRGNTLLLDRPLEERRQQLEEELREAGPLLLISPQRGIRSHEELDGLFAEARDRSNEGLVLKRRGSLYEAGRRSGVWCKVKRAFGTLDVVVTAAEQGHGKRASMLSDYTFAVREGDRFLNVGKAYSGLTDEEIRELTRRFRAITVEKFGRVSLVKPEVVLEVAFDGIQKSPRHKSGYALRFPRILRWRTDKTVAEIDGIETVAALYAATLR